MDHHQQLRLFLHLADSLNFGRTSSDCHVSPATLSRTVQRLERLAGGRLLDRGPRGVWLTAAGQRFREYALRTLELWDGYHAAEGASALSGRLSVFATVTACQALVPDLLAPFRRSHPDVRIDLTTGDAPAAMARLDEGSVDVAIAALPERLPDHLSGRELTRTPLTFVAAVDRPDLARVPERDDWETVPYVLPRRGLVREYADRWFRERRIVPVVDSEPDGHEPLLALVAMGCGVGVVPGLVLDGSAVGDRLVSLRAEPALPVFRIGLCARRTDLRRPVLSALWSSVLP